MFYSRDVVLVAVSGGPDSVALLHALHLTSSELGISLHVAHINHGIRGSESDADEQFVREFAHSLGLPITCKGVDVPALRSELRVGVEEAARIARLSFLEETAAAVGANKIALGHTADDRAESVLLNIIRGCGIDGLGSIRPVSGMFVRPLIDTYRSEIEAYIAENALPYRIDASNTDVTYTRNRVRHELLPLLQASFNPEIKSALIKLAEITAPQADLMASLAGSATAALIYAGRLDVSLLLYLPLALQREVVRREIERVKGDLRDVTFDQVDGILAALRESADFTITLPPGDMDAVRRGESFYVARRESIEQPEPFSCPLSVPSVTPIPSLGLSISCEIVRNPRITHLPPNEALIAADAVVGSLWVRDIRPGDRIVPLGMSGSKKLQDVFIDKKVPRAQRARAVAVVDDEKILWVPGVVPSDLGKITQETASAIRLCAAPCSQSRSCE